jgi:hypothetical protein
MGLFDFLRRKPRTLAESEGAEADLDEPRCHHYMLAHYALRTVAHDKPLAFLGVLASPDATHFLSDLMESVSEHCKDRERHPDFSVEAIRIHTLRIGKYPCAVVQMPKPRAPTEAFFVAGVLLADPNEEMPESDRVALRYFTLEKGITLGGPARTVLCEWTADGTHANFGDGPPAELRAFCGAVEELLASP